MKYLLIITTLLLLLNCTSEITKESYTGATSWCSVEKWNNGDLKEIYTIDQGLTVDGEYTDVIAVSIDSIKSDTVFFSTDKKKHIMVDKPFSDVYELGEYNSWYGREVKGSWPRTDFMYSGEKEYVECSE
jgi:hypothetical protein